MSPASSNLQESYGLGLQSHLLEDTDPNNARLVFPRIVTAMQDSNSIMQDIPDVSKLQIYDKL